MPENRPSSKMPSFRTGETLRAPALEKMARAVDRLSGINAPVQPKPRGKTGGAPVQILTLVSHENDYLECEDAGSNTVYVAKPYELRRTPFDGETIGGVEYTYVSASERTASDGASPPEEETQYITPSYVVGAEIYAVRPATETGVETTDSPPEAITLIEMNQGRAWAYDPEA